MRISDWSSDVCSSYLIDGLKATRDQARADAECASALLVSSAQQAITPPMLRKFASTARPRLRLEGGGYRRDHLRALAQRVAVDKGEGRIMSSKRTLLRVHAANVVGQAVGDRKSGLEGTSGSVRVARGGRRATNQKRQQTSK